MSSGDRRSVAATCPTNAYVLSILKIQTKPFAPPFLAWNARAIAGIHQRLRDPHREPLS
jgi:hypothetical protein